MALERLIRGKGPRVAAGVLRTGPVSEATQPLPQSNAGCLD